MSRLQQNLSIIVVALALALAYGKGGGGSILNSAPIEADGLVVLILEESEQTHTLPGGQQDILGSQGWRQEWAAAGGEIRVFDPVTESGTWRDYSTLEPKWQQAVAAIKETPLPAFVVSNGRSGEKGTLPQTLEEWEKLLARYRGP